MSLSACLYLIDFFSSINFFFSVPLVIYIILFVFCGLLMSTNGINDDDVIGFMKFLRKICWIPILCSIVICIIPSKSTMYMILGANFLESSHVPAKVAEALELKLDDVIKQLKMKKIRISND